MYALWYRHLATGVNSLLHNNFIVSFTAIFKVQHSPSIYSIVHKEIYWIRTNLRRFQPSNVKCNIRMSILCKMIMYLVISIVLVPYISSEFMNIGFTNLLNVPIMIFILQKCFVSIL